MKKLKKIGILVFLSISVCAISQNSTINRMDKTIKALDRVQQTLGLNESPEINSQETVTDIDGNIYQTVKVGNKIWMAENLKVNRYRNGDSIANITDSALWVGMTTGAWCEYNNDHINGEKFGKLYNFFAVSDKRELAPKGWHVATDDEWDELINNCAGGKAELDGVTYTSIVDYNNKMHFDLYAGVRTLENFFDGDGSFSFYWTSYSFESKNGAMYCKHEYWSTGDRLITAGCRWYENNKINGCSVRCVKDAPVVKTITNPTTKKK